MWNLYHGKVISTTVWITSNTRQLYTLLFGRKLKQEESLFPHFPSSNYCSNSILFRLWCKYKGNFLTSKFIKSCSLRSCYLIFNWKWFFCNVMTCLEANIWRVKQFCQCFPSTIYVQLVIYQHSVFGSMYLCGKIFLKMKYVESHYRAALTGEHLQLILIIGEVTLNPNSTNCRIPFSLVDPYYINLYLLLDLNLEFYE